MTSILSYAPTCGPIGGHNGLNAKLYPNGEVVVYKPRTNVMTPMVPPHEYDEAGLFASCMRAYGSLAPALLAGLVPLGLSPHPNFDKLLKPRLPADEGAPGVVKSYGRNGITSFGARRVRNGCHLIERSLPKMCTVFATCTVPSLPIESMATLHERWNKVVEAYRRKLTRALRDEGLSGESCTVSEIQSKRYENTGIPVLHIHTVFGGRTSSGKPAITPERHDKMWRESLSIALGSDVPEVGSACNLQWVKKSAEGYLGKYMTKGTKVVKDLCVAGFGGWLPKQWWAMSRSLASRIDSETRRIDEFAEWLTDVAEKEGSDVWLWHRDICLEMSDGTVVTMARFGKLSNRQATEIQAYYSTRVP